jgi:hexosaminidase
MHFPPALRNLVNLPFCILLISYFAACTSGEKERDEKSIAVHWELMTNLTDKENVFKAKFQLKNNSTRALSENNWALFFSMAPRQILTSESPQSASLHHINGDWYKMTPNQNFRLKPSETAVIVYNGVEGVIKETDRPLGLYFVFYDDAGNEQEIVEVTDYTWTSFTKPEQIDRNREDEEPIPTTEWSYKNNLDLQPVPDSKINLIIPSPVRLQVGPDSLKVTDEIEIYYQYDLQKEATYLASTLKDITGQEFKLVTTPSSKKLITLWLEKTNVNGTSKEAYSLNVNTDGITIKGSDRAGVFYGIQTLRALIPISAYQKKNASLSLPSVVVEDAPRFAFRSLHLDVSRNFQTKETILSLLDLLSFYKINRFLFYTTEDEGWRVEIKDLPELTTVGAQRQHTTGKETSVLHPAYGSGPFAKADGKFGHGYYTRADFVEILKYASDRHIKVIPELNFPGHARAAIKAMEARYERLMKEGKEEEANEYRLIDPDDESEYLSAQGYKDNVVCVARESVFRFYEKVVDEIAVMYQEAGLTLDEFHTGGDEVPEGAWTKSPLALALLKDHPEIKDPQNLQTFFFRELVKRLKKRNLRAHGWEEVALMKTPDGEYVPNPEFAKDKVVPYIWNNMFDHPDLGYRLANAGYDVVLCNVSNFYFDLAYSKDPLEPGLYWAGFVNTRNAWTFAAYDMFKTTNKNSMGQALDFETGNKKAGGENKMIVENLKVESRRNILGVEAQLWSETIKGRDMLEYYMLPKLIGFAESAWASEREWETIGNKADREEKILEGWNIFANTLAKRDLPRLSYINSGYNYRVSPPGAVIENGMLKANVEYPGLIIRYTTDGTEPTIESTIYKEPVSASGNIRLKSFDVSGKSSRSVQVPLE